MHDILFSFESSCISHAHIIEQFQKLQPHITHIRAQLSKQYQTVYASLYAPFDTDAQHAVQNLVDHYAQHDIATVVVIGIGGSAMGTRAIASALNKQIIFLETVDSDACTAILAQLEALLKAGKKIVVTVITKSGTTTETIVNFQLVLALMQKYLPQTYQEYIVVITDTGSPLENVAHAKKFHILSIPPQVGGRYSVFSAVGLFPLALVGIDIEQLLAGARDGYAAATTDSIENNAARSACTKVVQYKNGITLFDMFIFSLSFADIGLWYRQLFAESLGKAYNTHGSLVEIGMTPLVSIGSTDLHSIGQRYLGGSRAIFTTFLDVAKNNSNVHIPHYPEFDICVKHIQDRPVADIMQAIVAGTKHAYAADCRPFMSVTIPDKDAYFCGKLLQMYMCEVMYMGYLLEVDPFDQPAVEAYKKETRRLLQSQ